MVMEDLSAEEFAMLFSTFKAEIESQVTQIVQDLLELEKSPTDARRTTILQEVMREAHNIKGAARIVELDEVASVAQHFESVLAAVRDRKIEPDLELFDVLHRACDDMIHAVEVRIEGGCHDTSGTIKDLQANLERRGQEREASADGSAKLEPIDVPSSIKPDALLDAQVTYSADLESVITNQQPEKERETLDIEENVYISTRKLDELLDLIGELSSTKLRQDQDLEKLGAFTRTLELSSRSLADVKTLAEQLLKRSSDRDVQKIAATCIDMQAQSHETVLFLRDVVRDTHRDARTLTLLMEFIRDRIKRTRMLPIGTVFDSFGKMVREVARGIDKSIHLIVEGRDVELDKKMLENIRDPLMHLIRNACDHGIESPSQRISLGKPERGTIRLQAEQRGSSVRIIVQDDGRGIDPDELRAQIVTKGLLSEEKARSLRNDQMLAYLFQPGFSTRQVVTDISGRGVGLDVVKHNLEQLQGTVDLETEPGLGSLFTLRLPLTLATVRVLIVQVAGEMFGMPSLAIDKIVKVTPTMIETVEGRDVVLVQGNPVPLFRLQDVLSLSGATTSMNQTGFLYCLHMSSSGRRALFTIDGLHEEQDLVMKKLAETDSRISCVAGGAILNNGRVLIILNPVDVMAQTLETQQVTVASLITEEKDRARRVLVVDDSITTRNFVKTVLAAAGYDVTVASNGSEGLDVLSRQDFDCVLSDIQMPEMDGITMTERIKQDPRTSSLPVILISSLEKENDISRGLEAGADAYITKSSFDRRTILETLSRLI